VKTRAAILENRGKIRDDGLDDRPTLRRSSNQGEQSTTEEDRPTLKRRDTY